MHAEGPYNSMGEPLGTTQIGWGLARLYPVVTRDGLGLPAIYSIAGLGRNPASACTGLLTQFSIAGPCMHIGDGLLPTILKGWGRGALTDPSPVGRAEPYIYSWRSSAAEADRQPAHII